jgi:hypothetical protein
VIRALAVGTRLEVVVTIGQPLDVLPLTGECPCCGEDAAGATVALEAVQRRFPATVARHLDPSSRVDTGRVARGHDAFPARTELLLPCGNGSIASGTATTSSWRRCPHERR